MTGKAELRAVIQALREELKEARLVAKEKTYHLTVAHLHLRNYEDHIEVLEAKIRGLEGQEGPSPSPVPGHRIELGVSKQQHPVWYRDMDVGNGKEAQIAARRVKVAELMEAGVSRTDIADRLGVSVMTVARDKKALRKE